MVSRHFGVPPAQVSRHGFQLQASSFASLFGGTSSHQQAPINTAPVSYDDSLTDLSVSSSSIDLSATIRVEKPITEHETAEEKRIADEAAAVEAMRVADEARGG
ncbi:hypothetical protein CF327_g7201 [Tilletia walkeri]|nr:hypothetical protein CF327_g7201 [Tilletia walkeri]